MNELINEWMNEGMKEWMNINVKTKIIYFKWYKWISASRHYNVQYENGYLFRDLL